MHGVKRFSDMIAESVYNHANDLPRSNAMVQMGYDWQCMVVMALQKNVQASKSVVVPECNSHGSDATESWHSVTLAGSGLKPLGSRLQVLACEEVTKSDPAYNLLGTFYH